MQDFGQLLASKPCKVPTDFGLDAGFARVFVYQRNAVERRRAIRGERLYAVGDC